MQGVGFRTLTWAPSPVYEDKNFSTIGPSSTISTRTFTSAPRIFWNYLYWQRKAERVHTHKEKSLVMPNSSQVTADDEKTLLHCRH